MVRIKTILIMALGVLVLPPGAYAEEATMKAGKWSITTTTMVPMMGPMEHTMTSCFSETDLKPQKMMKQEGDCHIDDMKTSGSTVTWGIACKNQGGEFKGSASATSAPESLSGQMKMTMTMNGQTMTMETKWKGKYLGACDKN